MTKFTIDDGDAGEWGIFEENTGKEIAYLTNGGSRELAALFAAAPDMLKALRRALSHIEINAIPRRGFTAASYKQQQETLDLIKKAIAKSEA